MEQKPPEKKAVTPSMRSSTHSYYTEESEPASLSTSNRRLKNSNGSIQTLSISTLTESRELASGNIHKIWCSVQIEALKKKEPQQKTQTHIDFIVVIDHSSSMRMNNKLAFVKATIQYLVEQLSESHRFCLIEFNHEVNMVTEGLLAMNDDNKKVVLENLKRIRPEGSTNISEALFTAINILKQRPSNESARISSVMLFTDGLANAGLRGNKFINEITAMTVPPGLTISTFGYGVDHDSKMLQNISFCSKGGVYYYIETTESIGATFGECLAGILSTVAHNVNVKLIGADGCRIVSFYTKYPITEHKSVKEYTVSLGSLFSEESRTILFKLSLRKLTESVNSIELLTAKLTYTNTLTNEDIETPTVVAVGRPEIPSPEASAMPPELDKHINRYTAAVAMETAATRASSKDFTGAQKEIQEVIKLVEQSVSAHTPQSQKYCEDLVADLKEVSDGMEDSNAFTSGVHYVHAYSTMYYMERSTGTTNLLGIRDALQTNSAERMKNKTKRHAGYGYKTKDQEEGAKGAVDKQKHYVAEYLSN